MYKFTELQEKWLQALESGKYEQTQCELCLNGKYCCLGVATHVFDPDHQALKDNGWYPNPDHGVDKTAPKDVVEALKLNSKAGNFSDDNALGGYESLVDLNDDGDLTFKQIAEFIRDNPELVFQDWSEDV